MSAEAILRHSQKLISNAVAAHRYNTADLTSMNNGSIAVLNEIDPTYHLACMFLRANIPTFLETTRVSLAAAIKNDFATEREFAEIAMSDELANVVVEYRESLSRYVNKPTCRLQLPFEYGAQGYSDREKRAYRFSWLYPTRVNSIKQLEKKHNL